ncbi:MAG: hypothetical protein ICV64_01410 [Thermoleophilia bacterium]|nr:hypothetical protein [Thermoleophilia bacterium]
MPAWYLIVSAIVGILVLGGIAYAELNARRRREPRAAFAGGVDIAAADAPTRREADTQFDLRERYERERAKAR